MAANENRIGYKKTKLGWIPKDWKITQLKKIIKERKCRYGIYKEKSLYGTGALIIKISDVFRTYFYTGEEINRVKMTEKELKMNEACVNDIFIAVASMKKEGIGKVMYVSNLKERTAFDHNVALIRADTLKAYPQYLFYVFNSTITRKIIESFATKVGTTFIKASVIDKFNVPLPPLPEQKKIAKILSAWDDAIATTEKLIAAKEKLKKGLMQQLLTGKKRFKEFEGKVWNKVKLGEMCDFTQGVQIPDKETFKEYKKGLIRYLYIRDFFTDKFKTYVKNEYPNKIMNPEDIMMVNTGNTAGAVYRGKIGVLCNNAFKISIKDDKAEILCSEYLWQFLNSERKDILLIKLFNSAGQPHVGHSNIDRLKFPLFELKEQQKIASFLSDCDLDAYSGESCHLFWFKPATL